MIGLGGGSLAKFFHRRLHATRVRVVELDRRIVDTARAHFALPPDDAWLAVEVGDGAHALTPECCDVLVVDAFHDEHQVAQLTRVEFYDAAFLALSEPGALVVNFMNDDPGFDRSLRRIERAFGGAVLALPALYDPNLIVFAFRGAPARLQWDALKKRAAALESRLGLPFARYVSRLRAMNSCTSEALIIHS